MQIDEKIQFLIKSKTTFNAKVCGDMCNFYFPTIDKKTNYSTGKVFRKGSHLNKMVLREVRKRVDDGDYVLLPFKEDEATPVAFCDKEAIHRNMNDKCYGVDINSCYWTTIYNIGAISEDLYQYGLKDSIPKLTRNSSIGSLGAYIRNIEVVDGEIKKDKSRRRDLFPARVDVMKTVWALALEIHKELEGELLMFLTDCFFVSEAGLSKLYNVLERNNYDHKTEDIVFAKTEDYTDSLYIEWMAINKGVDVKYKTMYINKNQFIENILNHGERER
jgi:hypothetical protein